MLAKTTKYVIITTMRYIYEGYSKDPVPTPIEDKLLTEGNGHDKLTRPNPGDFTDSIDYEIAVEQYNKSIRERGPQVPKGCLSQEVELYGLGSKTPQTCPVDGCKVTVDQGTLKLENQAACLSPLSQPKPNYLRA